MEDDTRFNARPRPALCMHGVIGDCEQCTGIDDAAERAGNRIGQLLKAKLIAKVAKLEAEKELQAIIEKHRIASEVFFAADEVFFAADNALQEWLRRSGAVE